MPSSLRKPVGVGILAGALTAVAVFGGTGAFLAAAQDSPDTTQTPDTTQSPDTTQAPDEAPAPPDEGEREEWRQCMTEQGVELPILERDENGRVKRPVERPVLDEAEREEFKAALDVCGPPPGRHHHRGFGRGCDDDKGSSEAPAPDESTPEDTAPQAEGSSFAA